mmetsp:Transcript_6165/g.9051  ORF Transcript_6165/g.9051 Transcript_6165/m.9051 type:complete len:375 (-) Transcript_6165:1897-3021(-)
MIKLPSLTLRSLFSRGCTSSTGMTSFRKIAASNIRSISAFHAGDVGGGYLMTGANRTRKPKILVTGAVGQIGQELVPVLRNIHGAENVIATDVRQPTYKMYESGPFHYLDILEINQLCRLIIEDNVQTIVHLAAILSATGEQHPQMALKINNEGTHNVLELARKHKLKVFTPSTIAVFGPGTPKENTPDDCIMRPVTMYGITKVHAELLGEYYHRHFGVDFRSLRYPGVVSAKAMPGGGTTDYAVEIYHEAIANGHYTCFLGEDTMLPMIYMPDLIRATVDFIDTDPTLLSRRVYNIGAMSFTPRELSESIKKSLTDFHISYQPDFRQAIADTWPEKIDYCLASNDWGWRPNYDVDSMTNDMLSALTDSNQDEV